MPLFYPGPLPVSLPVMSLLCQCFILLLTHMVVISWVAGLEVIFSLYTLPTFRPFIYSASSTCLLYYNVSQVCISCPVRVVISLLPSLSSHPWIKTIPYSQVATTGPGSHTVMRPLPGVITIRSEDLQQLRMEILLWHVSEFTWRAC